MMYLICFRLYLEYNTNNVDVYICLIIINILILSDYKLMQ